ncbi:histidine phosphatase family protein [Naasia sp.]|uniref:histidine phosphatase family protein n=1 Tax=Naasia sp. TaxID=2546198 RepID=UPI00261E7D18|nr:histidine phosphatase family protein [Naasia sp.]
MVASALHLVRHGEVHNPAGVLYGRIPGFRLSDLGQQMASSAATALAARPVRRVVASPLQRTQESAAPIAAAFELEVETDERLIEPFNRFEGKKFEFGPGLLSNPEAWPWVSNPFRPSWGEPYVQIAARMLAALTDAHASVEDGDVVLVSHQLPIWMVHRSLKGERLYHDPRRRRCSLSSITTVEKRGERFVETAYADPAGPLAGSAVDRGAV